MSAKMQVLFVKQTGHVLAAFTRTADPEGKLKVSDLVGTGLQVRNPRITTMPSTVDGGETLIVDAGPLDISVVDLEPKVFDSPRDFVIGGGKVAELGATPTITLSPASDPVPQPPGPSPTSSPPKINFSPQRVTVVMEADGADEKGVCVLLEEAGPVLGAEPVRRVAQGSVPKGSHFVSLDWKTSPDGVEASIPGPLRPFVILALVAGYPPLLGSRPPSTT